jgi:beta-glucosidase
MAWGLEDKTVPERVAAAINGGTDTLSGFATNKTVKDLLDAKADQRRNASTRPPGSLLKEQFQLGTVREPLCGCQQGGGTIGQDEPTGPKGLRCRKNRWCC